MSNATQGSAGGPTNGCSCPLSQYTYNASAYGFAAELSRPMRHSIPTQAASVLSAGGGGSHSRVQDFKYDSFISVADAHTEVGGSYDACHKIHTSYAFSALEKVNVANVLLADRIVSRLYIYAPEDPAEETTFSIAGSHFENLRIAGHKVEVQFPTSEFAAYDAFSEVSKAGKWMVGTELATRLAGGALTALEDAYHALKGMTGLIKGLQKPDPNRSAYLLSPANDLKLEGHKNGDPKKKKNGEHDWINSGIQQFGNVICVPKFGVIRLAELLVHKHCRTLTMFRVQMCSGHTGSSDGGGTSGGGGTTGP